MTLLLAAIGAASESSPLTAAAIKARASVAAEAEDAALVEADADLAIHLLGNDGASDDDGAAPPSSSDPPRREREPLLTIPTLDDGTQKGNRTNSTNQTRPPAPQPPPNGTPADKPAVLSPDRQNVSGMAGAPVRFVLFVTNPAKVAQNVTLLVKSPSGWDVRITPTSAFLGPDETIPIHGSAVTPRLVGTLGTIAITASGAGGDDVAYVDVCSAGELGNACESQRARPPPANHTSPPPSNHTPPQNETPPGNGTSTSPPPPTQEPPQNETCDPNETILPTFPSYERPRPHRDNQTGNSTGNTTGSSSGGSSGNSTSSSGSSSGSAYVGAWVSIEAGSSGGTDEEEAAPAEDEAEAEAEEEEGTSSSRPVQVDL